MRTYRLLPVAVVAVAVTAGFALVADLSGVTRTASASAATAGGLAATTPAPGYAAPQALPCIVPPSLDPRGPALPAPARSCVVPPTPVPTTPAPTTPAPPTPAPAPVAGPATAWACRTGSAQAGSSLDVTGTVCARSAGGQWQGRATVRLTSRSAAVDGVVYLSYNVLPEQPTFGLTSVKFHVPKKGSVTIPLTVVGAATPDETAAWIEAVVQPNWLPGYGSGDASTLSSPAVTRTKASATPLTSRRVTGRVCTTGKIAYTNVTATYTWCTRQVRGRLVGSGTITYRTTAKNVQAFITVGQSVNGRRVASGSVMLPGTLTTRTVPLPALTSRLLVGDRTATAYAFTDTVQHTSKGLRLG